MKKQFYSNGKLLLTAEYLVLDGAEALAVPTCFGQYLDIEVTQSGVLDWVSIDADGQIWYADSIAIQDIVHDDVFTSENEITQTLYKILKQAHTQNPDVLSLSMGFDVVTRLTFPKNWGLGTSSTLINNIAQWFAIDAFDLLKNSFGGSGYDIACAQTNQPIVYQLVNSKPVFKPVIFNPIATKKIFFVYLNQKRNSRDAIASYKQKKIHSQDILHINQYTHRFLKATETVDFANLINDHESFMASVLDCETVKQALFSDFDGSIKSLGAWGGDFVLVVSENPEAQTYFINKGYETILSYDEMILG